MCASRNTCASWPIRAELHASGWRHVQIVSICNYVITYLILYMHLNCLAMHCYMHAEKGGVAYQFRKALQHLAALAGQWCHPTLRCLYLASLRRRKSMGFLGKWSASGGVIHIQYIYIILYHIVWWDSVSYYDILCIYIILYHSISFCIIVWI